jgi:predicted alpha/beta-fold hydrolase
MRAELCADSCRLHGPYRAPFWLPGGNIQTLWPLVIKGRTPAYRRERWQTPDDDFIDLDWIDAPATDAAVPTVVLFHGLEGSSASHYARALMRAVAERRWRGVVVNFRGCSGEPNQLVRSYHSGDSNEIDWVLRRLKANAICSDAPIFAAGVSLGGNALLKWLGEQANTAINIIDAAAAISAPLDLAAASRNLASGFNRIYTKNFLNTLIPRALAKDQRFPGIIDVPRLKAARTLADFDDAVIAPVHGFANANDYYAKCSSRSLLSLIRVPTLVLNAANDPFLPVSALPSAGDVSSAVELEIPSHGGHVGFVSDGLPGNIAWLPQRLLAHFAAQMNTNAQRLAANF